MLNKISENKYQFQVNVRESFTYEINFESRVVIFEYFCKTDKYSFLTTYPFDDFGLPIANVNPSDYKDIANLVCSSVDRYLITNIISGSVRRAFENFKQELSAVYNNFGLAQMLLV